MAMPIVQIHYQQIEQLIQRFGKQQTQVQTILQRLKQSIQALEHGGWQGDAASACFNEFNHEIVPAYTRLANVFSESQRVLQQLAVVFHEAEAEAAALFRGELELAIGSNPSEQRLTTNESAESDQTIPTQTGALGKLITSLNSQSFEVNLFLDAIAAATPAERQAILQDPTLLNVIKASAGDQAYLVMAALLTDSLRWVASQQAANGCISISLVDPQNRETRTNNFAQWICTPTDSNQQSNQPIDLSNPLAVSMNCWEFVLFSAFLGGNISYAAIDAIYPEVGTSVPLEAYTQKIYTALGGDKSKKWESGSIEAGSIVFFQTETSPITHVAYATGRMIGTSPEILSLWNEPNNTTSVQFTSIAELNGSEYTITYTPNPWQNDQEASWYNIENILSS